MLTATDRRAVSFRKLRTLEVVLKVTERCNLDCDYCYFFNAGDDSYKNHAAFISKDTVALLVRRLTEFSKEHKLERIAIHLHGGEPLLMSKAQLDSICDEIRSNLASVVDLSITIQTNGMLIDLEWIEILTDTASRWVSALTGRRRTTTPIDLIIVAGPHIRRPFAVWSCASDT